MDDGPLYDPASVTGRLVNESALLLGGARALLLQLAHPKVAEGVDRYSDFQADPWGRLARTLDAMNDISSGSRERREEVLARLRRVHGGVKGEGWTANDPDLLLWVHATLVDTVLEVERRYLGRLGPDERAEFYDQSKLMAAAFGIPDDMVPADYLAFLRYMSHQADTLEVSDTARRLARSILHPAVPLVPAPLWEPLRLVTVDMLPRPIRMGYGLGWDARRRAVLRATQALSRAVLPRVPGPVRNLPVSARRALFSPAQRAARALVKAS